MEYLALFQSVPEGGFVITFPDFGRGMSKGDNDLQAMDMARDLLQMLIQEKIRKGEELPQPGVWRGGDFRVVRLSDSLMSLPRSGSHPCIVR